MTLPKEIEGWEERMLSLGHSEACIDSPLRECNWNCPQEIVKVIKSFLAEEIDTLKTSFGGCENCYGKGYGTQTFFAVGSADFYGDKEYKTKLPTMVFCECERGKQLEKLIKAQLQQEIAKAREEIINELGSNPNEDGSVSPNIQHWIEAKTAQLKRMYLTK